MSETTTSAHADEPFVLVPPEVVAPIPVSHVEGSVPLPPDMQDKVVNEVDGYIESLVSDDPQSEEFRFTLNAAASIGRDEIAESITLANRYATKDQAAAEEAAYTALATMRSMFDELNPASQGDLRAPGKVLGIAVPFGNKLTKYQRRCQSAGSQLASIQGDIRAARNAVNGHVEEIGAVRGQMWSSLEKLEAAACFVNLFDEKLEEKRESIKPADPDRARAIEKNVLAAVRQSQNDIQAAQALTISAYNVLAELRKSGLETMNGCEHVAALGGAALSLPALTSGFAEDPSADLQTLQGLFDSTLEAIDMMEKYRANALATAQQNTRMLAEEVVKLRNRTGKQAAA